MRITLIAAVAENGVIGQDGDLPWRLPADLGHFQRTTRGHTMLMGRRTYESTGVLPGRTTIVLSRSGPRGEEGDGEGGLYWAGGYPEGVAKAKRLGTDELFICGGAGVYRQALEDPEAERMLLTQVGASPDGDTKFPEVRWSEWERVARDEHPADERNSFPYAFEEWHRR